MRSIFRSLFRRQNGFTLIEVIIGVALLGILGTGVTSMVSQTVSENVNNRNRMQATQELETAGYWLNRDVQMSAVVTVSGASGLPLVLSWTEWSGDTYQVTYSIVNGKFQRSQVVNGGAAAVMTLVPTINTGTSLTNCSYSGGMLTIKLTSTIGTTTETRTYRIKNRPV